VEIVQQILSSLESEQRLSLRIVGSSRPESAEEAATAVATAGKWRESVRGNYYPYNTARDAGAD
jgi:hypothetical protein